MEGQPPAYLDELYDFVANRLRDRNGSLCMSAELKDDDNILNDIAKAVVKNGYEQDIHWNISPKFVMVFQRSHEVGKFKVIGVDKVKVQFVPVSRTNSTACAKCGKDMVHIH